jgi:uncharacterized Zn-finger protein|tara:strand:- start:1208 stop:1369 length:162 start_codon:yes stop_codon:yes gene_type:complete
MVEDIEKVALNIETICCDGGQDGLGHPAVYYNFSKSNEVVCNYCGKKYIREQE